VNDTGVGTSTRNRTPKSQEWNIKTIIDHHLNPNNSIPYLIILSHCHYDHILGLNHLLHPTHDAKTPQHNPTILSSSHSRSFTTPRHNLKKHSLCNALNLPCPLYSTSIWANHHQHITYTHPSSGNTMTLPLLTLHTPGHTPDSLSWYDAEERVLYTGDSFYEQESDDSRAAPWGREKASPILFPKEGDVVEWWRSVGEMVRFVGERNAEGVGRRVVLAAGHVTAGRDAMDCLLGVRGFVAKVLRDEVGFEELPLKRGERFGLWSEHGSAFSLGAPFRVIEEARKAIPEVEWRNDV
jgi:glyoxylase-like metal-dependent hydrolase (beta-lactamase superfamily II)